MKRDDQLIAGILKLRRASFHDEAGLLHLMRHPVRQLLDHSGAVVRLQNHQGPRRIIGFDVAPGLVRALRLAARTVECGAYISSTNEEGPIVICPDRLRQLPLGPHLRSLASGYFVVHQYADSRPVCRSVFAFTGVRRRGEAQVARILNVITPSLHQAFFSAYQAPHLSLPNLTVSEYTICRLLLIGESNKEIARKLKKSDITVRNQLHAIFSKLGVNTRTAAALRLQELGAEFLAHGGNCRDSAMVHLYY